jgi:hypothetical protein
MASSRRARGRTGARATSPRGPRASISPGEHGQRAPVELSLHCAPARSHLLVVPTNAGGPATTPRARRRR